jgi:4-amino-4-deoxy-L-arabinose transferase-like glycosyltransferase
LAGALLSPLAFVLTRDLFPAAHRRAGWLAGVIVAVAGQPILSSVVVMADIPALFWAALSVWLVVQAWLRPARASWFLAAAGAAIALAVVSRWIYILVVPALALYVLYQIKAKRLRLWQTMWPIAAGLLILLPQLWLSAHRPEGLLHSWLLGWEPLNFIRRQFENVDGQYFYRLPVGVFYAQPAGHPAYIFTLLGFGGFWGVWRIWRRRQWGAALLLLGWFLPMYLFLAGIPYQNFRFGLSLYLPWVVLSAFGISEAWDWAARTKPLYRRLVQMGVTLSLLGMVAWAYPMLNNFLSAQNQRRAIAEQVAVQLPADATLLTFDLTLTLQHYTGLPTLEFFYCDEAALATLVQTREPLYLLLNVTNIETQWQGRGPQQNYHWLRDQVRLTEIDDFPPFTLFIVENEGNVLPTGDKTTPCAPPSSLTQAASALQ